MESPLMLTKYNRVVVEGFAVVSGSPINSFDCSVGEVSVVEGGGVSSLYCEVGELLCDRNSVVGGWMVVGVGYGFVSVEGGNLLVDG